MVLLTAVAYQGKLSMKFASAGEDDTVFFFHYLMVVSGWPFILFLVPSPEVADADSLISILVHLGRDSAPYVHDKYLTETLSLRCEECFGVLVINMTSTHYEGSSLSLCLYFSRSIPLMGCMLS